MAVNPKEIFNRENDGKKCFQIKKFWFVIIPDFGNTFETNDQNTNQDEIKQENVKKSPLFCICSENDDKNLSSILK